MGLLVRLPFHDAAKFHRRNDTNNTNINATTSSSSLAIGGADGCVDLDSAENNGLKEAIDLLEPIRQKAFIPTGEGEDEAILLSRADVWALAGNVMIESAGGPQLAYKVGRVDATDCAGQGERHVSAESTSSMDVERAFVEELGFTHREVVALIGAHVLGKASKVHSGYDGAWVQRNDRFTNDYYVDMLHVPWQRDTETVEPFGERTTWHRFEGMRNMPEIMLQADVDLAFQTTGGWFCSHMGGEFIKGLSCPNATHGFAEHVHEFAADEEEWREEFAVAWEKLTGMTESELECVMPDCWTPEESWSASEPSDEPRSSDSAAAMDGTTRFYGGLSLFMLAWHIL